MAVLFNAHGTLVAMPLMLLPFVSMRSHIRTQRERHMHAVRSGNFQVLLAGNIDLMQDLRTKVAAVRGHVFALHERPAQPPAAQLCNMLEASTCDSLVFLR